MHPYKRSKYINHRELPRLLAELDHEGQLLDESSPEMEIFLMKDSVYINGFFISGEIFQNYHCRCGNVLLYDRDFDSLFCPTCNEWREEGCSYSTCATCSPRPLKPLPDATTDDYPERSRVWNLNFITD